jgi:hypothetical protein
MIMIIGVKMKTNTILLAFAGFMLLSGIASAQEYNNAVSLTNISVSPNPVVAGGNVMISFQLYNQYDGWLYSTTLAPSSTYPILNVSPLSSYKIGTINPGATTNSYNYNIQIPATASSGTYTVTFTASYFVYGATGTVVASSVMPISFYVQNKPFIKIVASNPTPSTLYVGHNQTVDLLVENTGYGTAKNVSITVRKVTGLNILSSVTTFYAQNISQGASVSEPILVGAQNSSTGSLLVNATYYSSTLKQRFNTSQQINLSVAPAAQFAVSSSGYGPAVGATDVPINFKITNTGTSVASQLQVSLESSYPITPVSSTAYIANLSPGSSANITYMVSVDTSGVSGNYPVTLSEQWKQPNGATNQQYTGTNNYFVPVGSVAGTSISEEDIAIAVIIVVILAVVLMRRRRGAGAGAKKEKKQ